MAQATARYTGHRLNESHSQLTRRTMATGLALGALFASGVGLTATARQPSSGEVATRLFSAVFNEHADDVCREIVAAQALSTTPDGIFVGPTGVLQSAETLWTAFPNCWFTILGMVLDGDAASVHWAVTGNHLGSYAGVEPTGAPVTFEGISLVTVDSARISAHLMLYDRLSVLDLVRHPTLDEPTKPNGDR